jgi:hypothetical protein
MRPPSNAATVLQFLHDRLVCKYKENPQFDYMLRLEEICKWLRNYDETHLGPTDPTSPSSKPTTSESPTSTAGGSSKPPEDTLLDQLKAVMNSYGLSHLNVTRASELWSFGFSQTREPAQPLDLVKHAAAPCCP